MRDRDPIEWSKAQAELLRSRDFARLDIRSVIAAVEMVGEGEKEHFRLKVLSLVCSCLSNDMPIESVTETERRMLAIHREAVLSDMKSCYSFYTLLYDPAWLEKVWVTAITLKFPALPKDARPSKCRWKADELMGKVF